MNTNERERGVVRTVETARTVEDVWIAVTAVTVGTVGTVGTAGSVDAESVIAGTGWTVGLVTRDGGLGA